MSKYLRVWLTVLALGAVVAACESNDSQETERGAGAGGMSASGGRNQGGTASAGQPSAGHANGGGAALAGASNSGAAGVGGESPAQAGMGGAPSAGASNSAGDGGTSGDGGTAQGGEGGALVGDAGSTGAGGHEFAYVARILGGVLSCSVDLNTGETKLLPGPAVNPSGNATNIAVHPNQELVYVADERRHIDTYRIAPDGSLPPQPIASVATAGDLTALAVDPTGLFVYAASSQNQELYAFEVIFASGELIPIGNPLKVGSAPNFDQPAFLAVDPSGQFLYLTSRAEPGIRGYGINGATGALLELAGSPFATAGLPEGDSVFGGGIVFKPSGDFMYTSGGGLNAFSIDRGTGKLALVAGSPFTLDVQSDPNAPNIAMDPRGEYLYATRFLLTQDISGFAILPSGALEPVPNMPFKGDNPYSIAVDPSGQFVFVGVDGPTLAAYRITRATGFLTPVAGSEFQFGGLEPKIVFSSAH
jgi:6-phosphogluconolactonase (cycloisomerase 2 family)